MEGGTRFEPHNLLEKRTDAGVLKEGQVARGRPKACSQHRKHENGAEVLMRSALGAGHHASWRDTAAFSASAATEGTLESEVRLAALGHLSLTLTHHEMSKVIKVKKM